MALRALGTWSENPSETKVSQFFLPREEEEVEAAGTGSGPPSKPPNHLNLGISKYNFEKNDSRIFDSDELLGFRINHTE